MRTRRPPSWLFCLLVATFWPAVSGLAQPKPEPTPDPKFIMRGKWHIDFNRQDGFLRLTRERERGQGMRSPDPNPYRGPGELGLQRPSGAAKKPLTFKIHRDAGDFEFEGEANASEADGRFVFIADDDFLGSPNTEQLYFMTLYDVNIEFIRNLLGVTSGKPTFDQLIAMRMYGVDNNFLFGLKSLGYASVPAQDAIAIRKNGLTLDDARKIKAGRPAITLQELAREKPRSK